MIEAMTMRVARVRAAFIFCLCERLGVPLDFLCRCDDLTVAPMCRERSQNMLPLRASQAVGLDRGKQEQGKSQENVRRDARACTRRNLFARGFEALAESRLRKAEIEVQRHRSMYEEDRKK
jgi:hypothetical protein